MYAQLIVDAFRIKARTSAFLRELMRLDGRIWFTNQHVEDHLDSDSVLEQEMWHYQPYEEVWLLFDVLMDDFATKRIKNQEVIDLLRPSSRIRIRSKVKKQV